MKDKRATYSSNVKMAELLSSNPSLLSVIEKMGIKLGFGDATISQVCAEYGISPEFFLIVCNVYSFRGYNPPISILTMEDMKMLIKYLKSSHSYYKDINLKRLHSKIHEMVESCDEINKKILNKFYDEYDNEIKSHFAYEDKYVFPYMEAILNDDPNLDNLNCNIEEFERHHSDIEDKLNDFKNIIMKYLKQDEYSHISFEVLTDIFEIRNDLKAHADVEDKIFIPLAKRIIKTRKKI